MKMDGTLPKEQRILLAAETIFSRYGYEKATLDAIITLADVGKGTVYKYFGNKEHLFYTLVSNKNKPFVERLRLAVAGDGTLEEKLLAFFREMVAFYYENSSLWQIICFEMLGTNNDCRVQRVDGVVQVLPRFPQAEITEAVKEQVLRYHNLLTEEFSVLYQVLAEGMEAGELKQDGDMEISCKYIFFGVAMSIFNPSSSLKSRMTSDEAAKVIVDRYLYGEARR